MLKFITLWIRDHVIKSKSLNGTRIVVGSFAVIILVGTLLLCLPVASRSGESVGLLTALFTATSATCVTGLVLVDTWINWTFFGQFVILVMIQLGGLGMMTVLSILSFALHRRISLSERLLMASTFNLNDMEGVVRVVRHALVGTFALEGIGALIIATQFIPRFGFASGLWKSIFHAISSFCNAGFDLLGGEFGAFSSLIGFVDNPVVLGTTALLVVVGGLGFFVWEDIIIKRNYHDLSVYSKIVITMTTILLLGGMFFFAIEEFSNPATLGDMPLWQKWMNAAFQSVTLRTAGFDAIGQGGLTDSSKAFSSIFMMIGGSSGSTAGGIKTGTVAVLLLALRASLRGRDQVTFRGRAIPYQQVLNAMTLTLMVLCMFIASSMVLSTVENIPYMDMAYEVASAMGTVGLSTGITSTLSSFSKVWIIALMYLGRVGILSFSLGFIIHRSNLVKIKYPEINVMVG